MKIFFFIITVIIIGSVASYVFAPGQDEASIPDTDNINSFEECASSGYPVLESHPRQCKTPDNRTFVEIVLPTEEPPEEPPEEPDQDSGTLDQSTEFEQEFCGRSTHGECFVDSDCTTDGCSGEVCRSTNEESIVTICMFRECYRAEAYGMQCGCVNNECQWRQY